MRENEKEKEKKRKETRPPGRRRRIKTGEFEADATFALFFSFYVFLEIIRYNSNKIMQSFDDYTCLLTIEHLTLDLPSLYCFK